PRRAAAKKDDQRDRRLWRVAAQANRVLPKAPADLLACLPLDLDVNQERASSGRVRDRGEEIDGAVLGLGRVQDQLLVEKLHLRIRREPCGELGVHQEEEIPEERAEQRFEQVVVWGHGEFLLSPC